MPADLPSTPEWHEATHDGPIQRATGRVRSNGRRRVDKKPCGICGTGGRPVRHRPPPPCPLGDHPHADPTDQADQRRNEGRVPEVDFRACLPRRCAPLGRRGRQSHHIAGNCPMNADGYGREPGGSSSLAVSRVTMASPATQRNGRSAQPNVTHSMNSAPEHVPDTPVNQDRFASARTASASFPHHEHAIG